MKKQIWLVASSLLTLALIVQIGVQLLRPRNVILHASWAFTPQTFAEARDRAESIVLAEVVSVAPGEDLVVSLPGEPNGEDRIPTQRVTLKVVKAYKGATEGQTIELVQTGGTVLPPPPQAGEKAPIVEVKQVILEGDPLYQAGEQYLLMLERRANQATVQTIAPEGRYRVQGERLTAMVDSPVARAVQAQPLGHLAQALSGKADLSVDLPVDLSVEEPAVHDHQH